MNEEKKPKTVVERKFLLEKKGITLEDCKAYIQEFYPGDKQWFYDLCMTPNNETGHLVSFLHIKKEFYKKYFPKAKEMSSRAKLFADWGVENKKGEE